MRKALALTGALLLAGCVYPDPQHVALLNAYVGKPEADLVRGYGVPTRTFESGGAKFLAYDVHHIDDYPGFYGWGGWHRGWGWGAGYPGDIVERNCETTFELTNGVVKSWSLRGNAC